MSSVSVKLEERGDSWASGEARGDGYSNFTCGEAVVVADMGRVEGERLDSSVGRQKFA